MFKKTALYAVGLLLLVVTLPAFSGQDAVILQKVKAAEAGFRDMKADMVISDPDKNNVKGMGEGYGDILKLQKATVCFKTPDRIRFDGYAKGIKVVYLQNGYTKLIAAAMIRQKKEVKNEPGQRQDTLDLGFLSSRLWTDNIVTVEKTERNGTVELKFKPKFGTRDKRCDLVWINPKSLRLEKREKYLGGGAMRASYTYGDYENVGKSLPIACKLVMFDPKGGDLGTITYKNMVVNSGLSETLFSLNQR